MDTIDVETDTEDDVIARIKKIADQDSGSGFRKAGEGASGGGRSRIDRIDHTLRKVIKKGRRDNEEFAALNEKIDKLENEKRRDSLIVLLPRDFPKLEAPVENDFKFEERKAVVEKLFDRFMEDKNYTVLSVRHLNPARMGRQLCEVKLKDGAEAGRIRKTFVQKVKTQDDLKDATINLNQSPATRIRVEILKILAKRIDEEVPEGSKQGGLPEEVDRGEENVCGGVRFRQKLKNCQAELEKLAVPDRQRRLQKLNIGH
jgi:hypothetical protein